MNKANKIYPLVVIFLLLNIFSGCNEDASVTNSIPEIDGYELVWNDEFNNDGLPDPQNWGYDIGGHGWGNNELQNYTAKDMKTARVEDGNLIITAYLINESNNKSYRSARLVTRGKHAWKYGRIEMRAKLPGGRGTWPAFWMLPEEWNYGNGSWPDNGEIDIMEYVGYQPNVVHGTVHTDKRNHLQGTQAGASVQVGGVENEFNVYALEWDAEMISIYVNDYKYFEYRNDGRGWEYWPFDKEFHLILNIAIGGNWGGVEGVDDTIFPQDFVIDYVRVYQEID
jgi:beta-glucanase (GH16 family)